MTERSRIPPLSFSVSGSIADQIIDRLALHLRAKFPDAFGGMTLDAINLMFSDLRDEVARMVSHEQEED